MTFDANNLAELDKAINELEAQYLSECQSADWFNNNMPNVGITVDYQSRPSYPSALVTLKELRAKLTK